MTTLSLYSLPTYFKELDSLYKSFYSTSGYTPLHEYIEEADKILVKVELPGVSKENISVEFEKSTLKIKATRGKPEAEIKYTELFYGTLYKSIAIYPEIDKENIKAEYVDGILNLVLPKIDSAKYTKVTVT